MKTFEQYQTEAYRTAVYPEHIADLYLALGLAGEAGEIANKVKKIYRDKEGFIGADDRDALMSELGDVLWYLSVFATQLDIPLESLATQNIEKLKDRARRGVLQGDGDAR